MSSSKRTSSAGEIYSKTLTPCRWRLRQFTLQSKLWRIVSPSFQMIGFTWRVDKFFWFYFLLMCFTCFTLYGMMLVALTPGHQIAAIVMSFFLSFWNLFSGFLLPGMQIPIWWRWYYWGSPVAWTIYGLVTFQVGDRSPLVEIPGEAHMSVQIKTRLGFEYDFLGAVVAHISFVLLFLFVRICLRYKVSQLPNQMSK